MKTKGIGDIWNILADTGLFSIQFRLFYARYETVNSAKFICVSGLQMKVLIDAARFYSLKFRIQLYFKWQMRGPIRLLCLALRSQMQLAFKLILIYFNWLWETYPQHFRLLPRNLKKYFVYWLNVAVVQCPVSNIIIDAQFIHFILQRN